MKYFFSQSGDYLGGFDSGSLDKVPLTAIEVPAPPNHGLDRLVNGQIVPYVPVKPLNEQLEEAFLSVLPKHLGTAYLTNELIVQIGTLKQVVTDYNRLGLYSISKGMIAAIALPGEMEADRQELLSLYPQGV